MFQSGLSASELFKRGVSLAYDDFRILDTEYTCIEENEIDLSVNLGKGIILRTPIIASPMDTVTNAKVCIAVANMGGIGVIHMNYKTLDNMPDIDAQIKEIVQVKRHENGFIENPLAVPPDMPIREVVRLRTKNPFGIEIKTFPVIDSKKRLIGMLRNQDYSIHLHLNLLVHERMIPLSSILTLKMGVPLEVANRTLWDNHLLTIPIVDNDGRLISLVSRSDIEKNSNAPFATKDPQGRLRVLFAVETRPEIAYDRLKRGFEAGADGVVIDTSQGFTKYEKEMVEYIKSNYPDKLLVGGNVSTIEATRQLTEWGVDAIRIGQGSGSICTTALAIGISRASATGVYECGLIRKVGDTEGFKPPAIIADGGLKNVGDILKALSLGSSCVMLGNMLAGTDESPGEAKYNQETGEYVKEYRGMGSKEANTMGIRGYNKLPQGVSGVVVYKGPMRNLINLYRDGVLSGLKVLNCKNVEDLWSKTNEGKVRFEKNTANGAKEMDANVRLK